MAIDIEQNASAPAKVSGDSGAVEQHPIPDQIAADRYAASKAATQNKGLGLKLVKLSPPGAM